MLFRSRCGRQRRRAPTRSHTDFDTIIVNAGGADPNLDRRVLHAYADQPQPWMNHSDTRMGRKLPGLAQRSRLDLVAVDAPRRLRDRAHPRSPRPARRNRPQSDRFAAHRRRRPPPLASKRPGVHRQRIVLLRRDIVPRHHPQTLIRRAGRRGYRYGVLGVMLETDRLVLRPFEHDDLDALIRLHAEPSFWWYPFQRAWDRAETEVWLRRKVASPTTDWSVAAVELRATGQLAGWAGLSVPELLPEMPESRHCLNVPAVPSSLDDLRLLVSPSWGRRGDLFSRSLDWPGLTEYRLGTAKCEVALRDAYVLQLRDDAPLFGARVAHVVAIHLPR